MSDERVVQVRAEWLAEAIDHAAESAHVVVPWAALLNLDPSGLNGIGSASPATVTARLFEHPSVRAAIEGALPEIAKAITAEYRADFEQRIRKTEGELSVLRKLAAP